jgi:predicted dehydrogenase
MDRRLTRRKFLASSSAAVLAAPMVVRSAQPGSVLKIAVIGVNNRGAENLKGVAHEQIVALCDVDEAWSAKARDQFPKAAFFTDYRQLFDRMGQQLDAVVISTPDHSHALPAALALSLGKHVYCEKPLTHSVQEARLLRKLATEKKLVTQMGTQIHAGENYRRVVELVQAGVLGPIKRVHVWNSSKPVGGKKVGEKPTAKFDLNLWQGPCPDDFFEAVMNPSGWKFAWPHFHWRWWWEFGGGTLADLGCHYMDLPFWALGLTAPTEITATGKKTYNGDNTTPDLMQVDYQFSATASRPAVHLTWYHGVAGPDLEGRQTYPGYAAGVLFVGEKGQLLADYGKHTLLPKEFAESVSRPPKSIPASVGHHKEWCEAIKTGGPTTCHFGYSGLLTEAVLLGNVAYRVGKPIKWDTNQGTTGDPAADKLLGRAYRKGWELPTA